MVYGIKRAVMVSNGMQRKWATVSARMEERRTNTVDNMLDGELWQRTQMYRAELAG